MASQTIDLRIRVDIDGEGSLLAKDLRVAWLEDEGITLRVAGRTYTPTVTRVAARDPETD